MVNLNREIFSELVQVKGFQPASNHRHLSHHIRGVTLTEAVERSTLPLKCIKMCWSEVWLLWASMLARGAAMLTFALHCMDSWKADYSILHCSAPVSRGDSTLMTCSMVTGAWGNVGKNRGGGGVGLPWWGVVKYRRLHFFPASLSSLPYPPLSVSLLILYLIFPPSRRLTKPNNLTWVSILVCALLPGDHLKAGLGCWWQLLLKASCGWWWTAWDPQRKTTRDIHFRVTHTTLRIRSPMWKIIHHQHWEEWIYIWACAATNQAKTIAVKVASVCKKWAKDERNTLTLSV